MTATIEVLNLRRRFGDLEAVRDVTFRVEAGEIFGLLGPNGAGKTTTIQVMTTLLPPTSGVVRIAGYDVVTHPAAVRARIGLVFQEPSLDIHLTALENLEFHARLYRVDKHRAQQRIAALLEVVELSGRQHDLVKTFSGGMRRRLEIARALVHAPAVLFLDEPTTGLDPQTRARVWDYIEELRAREGTTVFMTTHYIDEAEHCDRVGIMDRGSLIACDTPSALKAATQGEVLTLGTDHPRELAAAIEQKFGLHPQQGRRTVVLEHPQASGLLPQLLTHLGGLILSVELRRPTLEDVFLKLTGRNLRPEET